MTIHADAMAVGVFFGLQCIVLLERLGLERIAAARGLFAFCRAPLRTGSLEFGPTITGAGPVSRSVMLSHASLVQQLNVEWRICEPVRSPNDTGDLI